MNERVVYICKDCGVVCERAENSPVVFKCENCMDRDRNYHERGLREDRG